MRSDSTLDLVDTLLSNETPTPKKRGRPKGSKNKKKPAAAPKQTRSLVVTKITPAQFVTQEEYERLGSPAFGYTTARIKQWKNRTNGYYEIKLEYYRAAILWSKLAKTMDWYSAVQEKQLKLCKLEIADFVKTQGLTKHDVGEVLAISHSHDHKRKRMLKELREIAKIVVQHRRNAATTEEDKKKVNFREVARIPPNVRPLLKHVIIEIPAVDLEAAESPQMTNEHACPEHLTYRGLRKPRNGCPTCRYFYDHNKSLGLKEKRNR